MQKTVELILSAASDPDLWEDALDAYSREFEIANITMFALDQEHSGRMNVLFSELARRPIFAEVATSFANASEQGDEAMNERIFGFDPLTFLDERMALGLGSDDVLPPSQFRQKLISAGLVSRTGMVLNQSGPWVDVLTFQHFSFEEQKRLIGSPECRLVASVLSKSIELGRTLATLRAKYRAALAALDFLQLGVALVDRDLRIVFANSEAKRIFEETRLVGRSADGRISSPSSQFMKAVESAASAALLAGADCAFAERLLTFDDTSDASEDVDALPGLIASIAPFADQEAELDRGMLGAFVLMIDPRSPIPFDTRGLAALGQLSKTEAEVLQAWIDGATKDEIAETRSTKPLTVRNQLGEAAKKLRCRTQADVVRLAALTRLPLVEK